MSSPANTQARSTYAVFAAMWAIAVLFHIGSYVHWGRNVHYLALSAAAIWLLVRPSSVPRLLLVAVLQLNEFWLKTPFIPNHTLVVAFMHLTILAAALRLAVVQRSFRLDGGELLRSFAPALRVELLILYFFAAFHKLNADYFDPSVSCANYLYNGQKQALTFLPDLAMTPIYVSFASEVLIPVFLALRPTRNFGILLGVGFHSLIVINPTAPAYNFSAMLLAAYLLFAPSSLVVEARKWLGASAWVGRLRALPDTPFSLGSLAGLVLGGALVLGVIAAIDLWPPSGLDLPGSSRGLFLLFFEVYSVGAVLVFVATLTRSKLWVAGEPGALRIRHAALLLFPLLMFANGWSPYVGLKTEQSFSMFSNLRTEAGRTNHFVMPTSLQLFDYQRDLVEPDRGGVAADPTRDDDYLLTFFEFRRLTSLQPKAPIRYRRNGQAVALDAIEMEPELAIPPPYLHRKFLAFRPVDPRERQRCAH